MSLPTYRPQPSILRVPHLILTRSLKIERSAPPDSSSFRLPAFNNVSEYVSMPKFGVASDVQPGEYIQNWCREHDIAFPGVVKSLKAKVPKNKFSLAAFYSRRHCLEVKSMRYFDKHEHPYSRTMFDIYIAKKKATLWYNVWGGTGARPFVISTAEQKLKHALRDALASYGYDRDGRKMASAAGDSVVADLYGSLTIKSTEPQKLCNAKFADLVKDMEFIVGAAEVHLRRARNGNFLEERPAPYQQNTRGGRSSCQDNKQWGDKRAHSAPARGYNRGLETGRRVNNAIFSRPQREG